MLRARRHAHGTVRFDKRRKTWNYLWYDAGTRRSKLIGTKQEFPTKAAAWKAVESFVKTARRSIPALTVRTLVEDYRKEKMPARASTKRGYDAWIDNHILPKWGDCPLSDLQARPVELWLQSLPLSPKSKQHIKGLLSVLWDYAMWRGDVAVQENPIGLVSIRGASKTMRKPRSLTVDQFQLLLAQFEQDLCFRTMLLLALSFGLRVSEVLGLKWKDVDWLGKTLRIERGMVRQICDDVKSSHSARTMVVADEILAALQQWKLVTQFSEAEDWLFASPAKIGRQPLSYTHVWETLSEAAVKAGIGHISFHSFRHTYRSWLDSTGTGVGVQQRLMRHADIRTTMNIYGDAFTADMRQAHEKVVGLALNRAQTERRPS